MRAAVSLLMAHACALVVGVVGLVGMGEARAESMALWQYGSSPEAVAHEWIDFATACNGNPQETYELLWCSYQVCSGSELRARAVCIQLSRESG